MKYRNFQFHKLFFSFTTLRDVKTQNYRVLKNDGADCLFQSYVTADVFHPSFFSIGIFIIPLINFRHGGYTLSAVYSEYQGL